MKEIFAALGLLLVMVSGLRADAEVLSAREQSRLLGFPLTASLTEEAHSTESGIETVQESQVSFLGRMVKLIQTKVQTLPETAPGGGVPIHRHETYIGGFRIWAADLRWQQGALSYTGGIAPTQIRVPVVSYPLGPVFLQVDAGLEFEGLLNLKLMPGLSYPLRDSSIVFNSKTHLFAGGFVEAYAHWLFVRAGVAGRLALVDADFGYHAFVYLNGHPVQSMSTGEVRFLNGRVTGFLDYRLGLRRWNRLLSKDFFKWEGRCLSFTGGIHACP